MLQKIYGTNFVHIKFGVVVASNVKIDTLSIKKTDIPPRHPRFTIDS
jgi:hypothetical protein